MEDAGRLGQLEVLLPAGNVGAQGLDYLVQASAAGPRRELTDSVPHRLQRLVCDAPAGLPRFLGRGREAQELTRLDPSDRAFRLVDAEPELGVEPSEEPQHTLAGAL